MKKEKERKYKTEVSLFRAVRILNEHFYKNYNYEYYK